MEKKTEKICEDLFYALVHKSQRTRSRSVCDMNSLPFFGYVCTKGKKVVVKSLEGNWISVIGDDWEILFKMED
jgi:hypothetical protein